MKKGFAMVLALAMLLGACAMAEGRTLTVQGVGVVQVAADRATVSLGVRETGPDVMSTQASVNEKIAAVIAALTEAGVEPGALSTGSIGIYSNYDYSGEVEQIVGYTAYNSLLFTVTDVDNVGSLIDAAFAAGANNLDYVEFNAADTAEAGEQALALAVQSAGKKAETLAAAAGVQLGEILEIRDNDEMGYGYGNAFAATEDAGKGMATSVLPSQQQVTAAVYITYALGE